MLLNIRDIVTGWLAAFIVALLIIPFAFWGINYYFEGGGSRDVATVNDRSISVAEFQQAYQDYRRQLRSALGEQMDTMNTELLKQEALNRLIETELLTQLVRDAGMRMPDEDVVEGISALEVFQNENGKFEQSRYQLALQRAGMTSTDFEGQMRSDMLLSQLRSALTRSAFVAEAEVVRLAQIESQTRDIIYTTLEAQPVYDSVEVSEEDIRSYYENNIEDYQAQPRVKIHYLDLTIDGLTGEVSVTDEDLRAYYENNESAYSVEETRKVTQMYIKLAEDAGQEAVDRARQAMEFIQQKLDEGMDMDEIATEYAQRLGPDFERISLGYTPRGVMAPALDEAAFSMGEGDISDIIRSQIGMHIIRLDGVRPSKTPAVEEVREEVEEDYRRYQAEQLFFEYADRLATLAYENPHTLEGVAEELGMELKTSGWFTEGGGEGIAAKPEIVIASFSEEILQEELNSEPIEIGDSRLVVLRKADYQPAQPLPLQEVRDEIVDDIKYERAREQTRAQGELILQALREGNSKEEVAAQFGIEWQEDEDVTRDDPDVSRAVLRTAFGVAAPSSDSLRFRGNELGSGDYIIVGVSAAHTPPADSLAEEKREEIRQELMQAVARNAWQDLIQEIRAGADIRINEQNLDI